MVLWQTHDNSYDILIKFKILILLYSDAGGILINVKYLWHRDNSKILFGIWRNG